MSLRIPTQPHTYHTGFTVVELMITVSIIVLVTGLSLSRFTSFDNRILLQSQAFEIGSDIRQAQQAGISVRANGGDLRNPFGIYFDESTPSQYIFFQDTVTENDTYDAGEELQTFFIDGRFIIDEVRVGSTAVGSAAVTFKRPNFDARISPNGTVLEVVIAATRESTNTKTVRVTETGQITVE